MKSPLESQILVEFGSIAKTSLFKMETENKVYPYKITTFLQMITRGFFNCKN